MLPSASNSRDECRLRWDARIARARRLASEHPASAELLTFYASLAEFQQRHATSPPSANRTDAGPAYERYLTRVDLAAAITRFLDWLPRHAPAALARTAARPRDWLSTVETYIASSGRGFISGDDALRTFIVEAVLQPFAERAALDRLASRRPDVAAVSPLGAHCTCPHCGGPPTVAVLRPEGQGAARTLLCGLCLVERGFRRGLCVSCGEQHVDSLRVHTVSRFEHVRIDGCDGCRTYLKTIDLSNNAFANPIVDDIASVSLDLWAREQGYQRLRANAVGI